MIKHKCGWCLGDPLYEAYHDTEWGFPVDDDFRLWVFGNFFIIKIAKYPQSKIDSLLENEGIIRNKLKIHATLTNARAFMNVQNEFGSFSNYMWGFVNGKPIKNSLSNYKLAPANTPISDAISKDMKKRGFKFVGSTIIYAHMQATGMVNDHEISCFRYDEV